MDASEMKLSVFEVIETCGIETLLIFDLSKIGIEACDAVARATIN